MYIHSNIINLIYNLFYGVIISKINLILYHKYGFMDKYFNFLITI